MGRFDEKVAVVTGAGRGSALMMPRAGAIILAFGAICGLALGALCGPTAAVADAPADQPIEILADQFEMLLDERKTTYTGNVVATQGERIITGHELIVRLDEDNQIVAMSAVGEPATLTDGGDVAELSLAGNALDYDVDESIVRSIGDGTLSQGADTISAQTIVYDLEAERARAVGDDKRRVTLRLSTE